MSEQTSSKVSAINIVFLAFIASAIIFGGAQGKISAVTDASFEAAKGAVSLAISLIGIMALWLGLIRVLEAGGFMYTLARLVKPVMVRLFPDVPAEHPAMSAMLLNMSANMLGLGNAATPFGIRAMEELKKLSALKNTATNAMCLFLAINTSSVALLPLGVIGVRAAAGASDPAAIMIPTFLATVASTVVAIISARALSKIDRGYQAEVEAASNDLEAVQDEEAGDEIKIQESGQGEDYSHLIAGQTPLGIAFGVLLIFGFLGAIAYRVLTQDLGANDSFVSAVTPWLMPGLMMAIICYGLIRGVKTYEAVTEGAKQGFEIAVRIIPFLVAILVAIGMFQASGAMDLLVYYLSDITEVIFMPAEVLPMALVRPLSGSGALGVMSALVNNAPDSYASYVASTMMGSTETTFYVLAVYFGSVGVTRIRHALAAALAADLTGIIVSCLVCNALWSGGG